MAIVSEGATRVNVSAATARVLGRLAGVRRQHGGFMAHCPSHEDHTPSLSLGENARGDTLLYCHAGCDPVRILAALDLTLRDLFATQRRRSWHG